MSLRNVLVVPAIWLATSTLALAGDSASGTITFKTGKCAIKYGWLVRGPDEVDPGKTVLRIYLSSVDMGAKIKACKTLSCADNSLTDGAMVDFSDARHLAYAVRLNGERLQYSVAPTAKPSRSPPMSRTALLANCTSTIRRSMGLRSTPPLISPL